MNTEYELNQKIITQRQKFAQTSKLINTNSYCILQSNKSHIANKVQFNNKTKPNYQTIYQKQIGEEKMIYNYRMKELNSRICIES